MHRPHDCCFLGRRGSGGLTDDRIQELCFCYFVFCCRRLVPSLAAGHALHPAGLAREGASPKRFCRVFWLFLSASSGAFLFLSGLVGFPLPCFSPSPLPSGASSLWVGGFPLPCFPGVFPVVLGVGGVRFLFCFFSCLLPLTSCIFLRVG